MQIRSTLEEQRKSLLDLTFRNRLLNLPRRPSVRSLVIHDELSREVLRMLLAKKAMSFAPMDGKSGETEEVSEDELAADALGPALGQPKTEPTEDVGEDGISTRHVDTKLQTLLKSERLQKRLLAMYYEARTLLEEQGVNVLYLACGQLSLIDRGNTEEPRRAPLILLPVSLERRSARERFVLKWTEEDPQENLSLREKLKTDYRIALPEFPSGDDFDADAYFAAVAEAVASQPGWSVDRNAILLGFFSFSKLLMFLDLDPGKWPKDEPLDANEAIQGLLGQGFADHSAHLSPGSEKLDILLPVKDMRHVVDCDSSQALAIESVRRGAHLVIQGPPGTGKSQTIANLIATAVADGKRVLFVAEKMAALEVVKRRLANVGLGPLCLELHSNKANKRAVVEELSRTLALSPPVPVDVRQNVERLTELRERLNEHADRMHVPIGKGQLTPYRIIGELAKRREKESKPQYRLEQASEWTMPDAELRAEALQNLVDHLKRVGLPSASPWRGIEHKPVMRPEGEEMLASVPLLRRSLAECVGASDALAIRLGVPAPKNLEGLIQQIEVGQCLADAPDFDRATISSAVWNAGIDALREAVKQGRALREIMRRRAGAVSDVAWDIDWLTTRQVIASRGRGLLRWFNSGWRGASNQLRSVVSGSPPKEVDEQLKLLDDLIAGRKARAVLGQHGEVARAAFGRVWQGLETRWDLAEAILEWVLAYAQGSNESIRTLASALTEREQLPQLLETARRTQGELLAQLRKLSERLRWNLSVAFGAECWESVRFADLEARLSLWEGGVSGLLAWLAFGESERHARRMGLEPVLVEVLNSRHSWQDAVPRFWLAFYLEMLSLAARLYPELASFDGRKHEDLVGKFREWDRRRLQSAQFEVAQTHHQRAPKQSSGAVGALGVLRGEIARKKGHMALRKLMRQCASPIQALKPVFMMSPLSVAQFLEPGSVKFELLVIDEASQVEPVDALGAIARCKQIVVVGDDKQLPPTSFFTRVTSEDDQEEAEDEAGAGAQDLESILSLCTAKGLPQRMLQWHYRSRHESLIAVSNKEFYDSQLFIVPSPDHGKTETGLQLRCLPNGRFDRGNSQKNIEEARAIADAVLEHSRSDPDLTLGVGAMSVRQRQAIIDEIELARRLHPELEEFIQSHNHEPFFVKNLENIQGDERDVILISIGYGRSKGDGKLYANFGPLNSDGGHRRLNVLITRARHRCVVFSSILAGDIHTDEHSKRGVLALKAFLKYAESGLLGIPSQTGKGADSPFEEAVQAAVAARGFEVHNQVGVAGFFIDLAVLDPENPGRYLLGIECDGASYHSAPSARDRDRLRQEVLEGHGWSIHRIWSTDWFQRKDEELDRLMDAIRNAKQRDDAARERSRRGEPHLVPGLQGNAPHGVIRREPDLMPTAPESAAATEYIQASFIPDERHKAPHEVSVGSMAHTVGRIIELEGPIHLDEIVARVRDLWGLGRAGSRIQAAVEAGLERACVERAIQSEDNCYWIKGASIPVRDRSRVDALSIKKPEVIPGVEIRTAVLEIIEECHGAGREELVIAVARRLGILSTSRSLRDKILQQVNHLIALHALVDKGELLEIQAKPARA